MRARLALASERLWPRLVPILSIVGFYIVLSWLGYWRLGGDWLRLGTLGLLGLALLVSLVWLARVSLPGRLDAMRRVELASGLPHRPARGLSDKISAVANDTAARSTLGGRAGAALRLAQEPQGRRTAAGDGQTRSERPSLRDPCAPGRSPSPSAGASGRPASAKPSSPVKVAPLAATARIDAWVDPPPYTRQAPVFLSRRPNAPASATASTAATTAPHAAASAMAATGPAKPVSVPEGSKLTVRVVSRDPAEVTLQTAGGAQALAPRALKAIRRIRAT